MEHVSHRAKERSIAIEFGESFNFNEDKFDSPLSGGISGVHVRFVREPIPFCGIVCDGRFRIGKSRSVNQFPVRSNAS